MADTHTFYTERADQSANDAASATLSNVRERSLRSEAAWRAMAERSEKSDQHRRTLAASKAAPTDAD